MEFMRKIAVAAVACGLLFRLGTAIITESTPIFPPHYYTDAVGFHENALKTKINWSDGRLELPKPPPSPSSQLYIASVALLYSIFGPHPLAPKLLNASLSAATILLWYLIAGSFLSERASTAALILLACWPTHVFFGSQNLKDAHVLFLSAASLLFGSKALLEDRIKRVAAWSLGAFALLLVTGFYRSYLMILIVGSLLCSLALSRFTRGERPFDWKKTAVLAFVFIAPILVFRPAANFVFGSLLVKPDRFKNDPSSRIHLLPATSPPEQPLQNIKPYSPQAITRFRQIRHSEDQKWAHRFSERRIKTQIFPDAVFSNWFDVAAYFPKGAAYALFMPLPGLYPSDNRLGRKLAMLENSLLLCAFLLAIAWWAMRPGASPAGTLLAVYFSSIAACYGVFEFDLGAATRHRLQYFPCVILFACAFCDLQWSRRGAR